MLKSILGILRRRPEFGLLLLASFLSNVGSGLTQVALYARLNEINAPSEYFAVSFLFAIVPGIFVGRFSTNLAERHSWAKIMIFAQVLGAVGVVPALIGVVQNSVWLLLTAEFAAAVTAGLCYPLLQSLLKRLFSEDELVPILKLDTIMFALTVVLGMGMGSLLIGRFGMRAYIGFDIVSYLVASLTIAAAGMLRPKSFVASQTPKQAGANGNSKRAEAMNPAQRQAFAILPILSLVGTPAMVLLPFAALRFGKSFDFFSFSIAPSVAFIFAKCLGQMLGPMLVPGRYLETLARGRVGLWLALAIFAVFYCFALTTDSGVAGLILVMFAHVASNVVFVVGLYAMQRSFGPQDIGMRSALQYRTQIAVMTISSLGAGYLAKAVSAPVVVVTALAAGLLVYASLVVAALAGTRSSNQDDAGVERHAAS